MTLAERLRDEPEYRPYCLSCSTMSRMKRTRTGFVCDPTFQEAPILVGNHVIAGRWGCGNSFNIAPIPQKEA